MKYRRLGKTNWQISEISFGAWAIGADWGNVSEEDALKTLHTALDNGINFFDTADVYGDGRSERLIARLRRERPNDEFYVATKAGRRLNPHNVTGYNAENLTRFVERSLKNLAVDALDLVQLHCPPTDTYYTPETFAALDELMAQGKIKHYGVSVEKVEEALKAIEYSNVKTVQIIFNAFRLRPSQLFFREALAKDVGILARVPLASGLLTGKYGLDSTFPANDHRNYNRDGAAFDVGETFSGVPYAAGVEAARQIGEIVPDGMTVAQFALRWILDFEAVSCAIPGGKKPSQVVDNARASEVGGFSAETHATIQQIYNALIREHVHHRW